MEAGARPRPIPPRSWNCYDLGMSDPKAEKKERQAAEAKAAWDEHLAQKAAVEKNTERLRALRLAKEASEAAGEKPAEKKETARRRVKRGKVG